MNKNKTIYILIVGFKVLIVLSFFSTLVGCGTTKLPLTKGTESYSNMDVYVEVILEALPYESPYRLPRIALKTNLTYTDSEGRERPAVGLCRRFENYRPIEILLDTEFWNSADEFERVALLSHEILHCMYGEGHSVSGLMAPFIADSVFELKKYGLEESIKRALDGTYEALDEGTAHRNCNHNHEESK